LRSSKRSLRTILATVAIPSLLNLTAHPQAFAGSESILWNFGNGSDGLNPEGGLIADKNGNLYGTTYEGGAFAPSGKSDTPSDIGGTVFELKPPSAIGGDWTESILWSFGYGTDGAKVVSGPIMDTSGNLYGTTAEGGTYGVGTVYELKPPSTTGGDWTESILWSFGNGKDGYYVTSGLIIDTSGNLYGTTALGGVYASASVNGGTVFELTPPSTAGEEWTESVIWNFGNGTDGQGPGGLIMDTSGNLDGTTGGGGTYGDGTVYELTPPPQPGGNWSESIFWSFGNGSDGQGPGGLIMDTSGNLYGTTLYGGSYFNASACNMRGSCSGGTVFELTPPPTAGGDWTESILWSFGNGIDGANPPGSLIFDASGNLYGTTSNGGAFGEPTGGHGIVFELSPPSAIGGDWIESILWNFENPPDGNTSNAGLIMDTSGNLYGTTTAGGLTNKFVQGLGFGPGGGIVFEINPTGSESPTPTPTPTVLTASPGKLNFGNVDATGTSKPKKVTLTNKGTVAAQISTVSVTTPFTIAGGSDTCSGENIAPKKTCSFSVEFAPTTVANESGGIDVTYNGASPAVTLAGEGIAVTLKAPKSASFTPVGAGSVGTPKNIVFSNPSTITVTLGTAALGGSDPGSFKIASDPCSGQPLAAKGTCAIGVEFAPPDNESGSQGATLSLGFTYGVNGGNALANLSGKVK
jgi:hypothetical protein